MNAPTEACAGPCVFCEGSGVDPRNDDYGPPWGVRTYPCEVCEGNRQGSAFLPENCRLTLAEMLDATDCPRLDEAVFFRHCARLGARTWRVPQPLGRAVHWT